MRQRARAGDRNVAQQVVRGPPFSEKANVVPSIRLMYSLMFPTAAVSVSSVSGSAIGRRSIHFCCRPAVSSSVSKTLMPSHDRPRSEE